MAGVAGIPCTGKQVYAWRYRAKWLAKIAEAGVRRRAEFCYQQFDALRLLRKDVRQELLTEAKKHEAWKLLRQIPFIGPIRAALIIAMLQTPHRFRTKRQLWTYIGFGIEHIAVPITTASMESCSARRDRFRFAD